MNEKSDKLDATLGKLIAESGERDKIWAFVRVKVKESKKNLGDVRDSIKNKRSVLGSKNHLLKDSNY
jgi:hypothetical protein